MQTDKPQIVAAGGGALSAGSASNSLPRYLVELADSSTPAVSFIGTASGDSDSYIVSFYSSFADFRCRLSHLPLFGRAPDLRKYVLSQDIIFVGGGNTKSMLAVWRDWGLSDILREAWQRGVILSGSSAGAICWFEQGVTDSFSGKLEPLDCLGFLDGSCCPHYDSESERRPAYRKLVTAGKISQGYALEDGAGLHFVGDELHHAVAWRAGATVFRVQLVDGKLSEEELPVREVSGIDAG